MDAVPNEIRRMKGFEEFYKVGETVRLNLTGRTGFSGVYWATLIPENDMKRDLFYKIILSTVDSYAGCEQTTVTR